MALGIATIQNSEHGVQSQNMAAEPLPAGVRWDDLRAFLAAVEAGGLRPASRLLNVSVNTVRARLDRLELAVGATLLVRSRDGCLITDAGSTLAHLARGMRSQVQDAFAPTPNRLIKPGELRIGASEALGSGWLTPRLKELTDGCPDLTISLICDYDIAVDHSSSLDVGIAWYPPRNPDIVVSRLATLHFMAFASPTYIREYGAPASMTELLEHRYVEQVAPGVKTGLLDQMVGLARPPGFIAMRTNSSLALFYAVVNGAGIAFMPTYAAAVTRKLTPIDLPFQLRFDLLYFYHPGARHSPAIRNAVDWLKKSFDPRVYPFFGQEFVHPREFVTQRHGNIVQLFEPFVEFA